MRGDSARHRCNPALHYLPDACGLNHTLEVRSLNCRSDEGRRRLTSGATSVIT